jgi:hypothetical protein
MCHSTPKELHSEVELSLRKSEPVQIPFGLSVGSFGGNHVGEKRSSIAQQFESCDVRRDRAGCGKKRPRELQDTRWLTEVS